MTVRFIVDANILISIHLILLQLNSHVQKNNMIFNSHLERINYFAATPDSSFIYKDILTKLYQVVVNIVVHRHTSHFFEFLFIFAFI